MCVFASLLPGQPEPTAQHEGRVYQLIEDLLKVLVLGALGLGLGLGCWCALVFAIALGFRLGILLIRPPLLIALTSMSTWVHTHA